MLVMSFYDLYMRRNTMSQKKHARNEFLWPVYAQEYNEAVFEGQLPEDMEIKWSQTLNTTAGVTNYK